MRIRFDRLQKLATHLKKGKLGHVKFDFSEVHVNGETITIKQKEKGFCGSAGCAVGELPMVFKKTWKYSTSKSYGCRIPSVRNIISKRAFGMGFGWNEVYKFFGISKMTSNHLFVPNSQIEEWTKNGDMVDAEATKTQVANNIEWFIKNKGFRKQGVAK